jgi:hypothetical protein
MTNRAQWSCFGFPCRALVIINPVLVQGDAHRGGGRRDGQRAGRHHGALRPAQGAGRQDRRHVQHRALLRWASSVCTCPAANEGRWTSRWLLTMLLPS